MQKYFIGPVSQRSKSSPLYQSSSTQELLPLSCFLSQCHSPKGLLGHQIGDLGDLNCSFINIWLLVYVISGVMWTLGALDKISTWVLAGVYLDKLQYCSKSKQRFSRHGLSKHWNRFLTLFKEIFVLGQDWIHNYSEAQFTSATISQFTMKEVGVWWASCLI